MDPLRRCAPRFEPESRYPKFFSWLENLKGRRSAEASHLGAPLVVPPLVHRSALFLLPWQQPNRAVGEFELRMIGRYRADRAHGEEVEKAQRP
jgi:hypothetical protein